MTKETGQKTRYFGWPINDRDSCYQAIRNGAIAAFISAGITAAFAAVGLFIDDSEGDRFFLFDPVNLIDALLLVEDTSYGPDPLCEAKDPPDRI